MNYEIFISELRCYRHYVYESEKVRSKLEEIDYELIGVKGVRYDKAPGTHNPSLQAERRLELIEKRAEIESELKKLEVKKKMIVDEFNKLDTHTKLMCLEVMNGKTLKQIAEKFGYSESGLMRKLKREIERA